MYIIFFFVNIVIFPEIYKQILIVSSILWGMQIANPKKFWYHIMLINFAQLCDAIVYYTRKCQNWKPVFQQRSQHWKA